MISTTFRSLIIVTVIFFYGNAFSNPIGIAAIVDGHEISEISLQKSVDQHLQTQVTSANLISNPEMYREVRLKVLDVLIDQHLLWRAAQSDNMVVNDETLNKAYQQYVAGFENESMFQLKLKQSGLTEDIFRDNLRKKLSAQHWLEESVFKNIDVTEEEITQFYEVNKSQFMQPEQVRASHILIQVPEDAEEEVAAAARSRIENIKQQLDNGAVFAELAREKSEDSSASRGGDLGYFPRGQMVPTFDKAAFSLSPGQVSDIVRTQFGYHLILLADKRTARQYEKVEIEQKIANYLWQQKSSEAIDAVIDDLRENADISISE